MAEATTGTGFLSSLLNPIGDFLGGTGGQLLGTGLGIDALNELRGLGTEAQSEALRIGQQAQTDTAFKPFSISTGFFNVSLVRLCRCSISANSLFRSSDR